MRPSGARLVQAAHAYGFRGACVWWGAHASLAASTKQSAVQAGDGRGFYRPGSRLSHGAAAGCRCLPCGLVTDDHRRATAPSGVQSGLPCKALHCELQQRGAHSTTKSAMRPLFQ